MHMFDHGDPEVDEHWRRLLSLGKQSDSVPSLPDPPEFDALSIAERADRRDTLKLLDSILSPEDQKEIELAARLEAAGREVAASVHRKRAGY